MRHCTRTPLRARFGTLAFTLASTLAFTQAHADSPPLPDPVGLRGDISGHWYDPAKPGQGLSIEMRDRNEATVAWYTFDTAGAPLWLIGSLKMDRSTLRGTVVGVAGGSFPPAFDLPNLRTIPWGELTLSFAGCDAGTLQWKPTTVGFTPGSMSITRLTAVQGARCNEAEEFTEVRRYSLERGNQDFEVLFADRPPGEDAFYELDYVYELLPAPLTGHRGMRLSGNNHSDDLAMLVKKEVEGLAPNALYRVEIDAEIASNVPSGCVGIGGSPSEGVYMKLGATSQEPLTRIGENGWLRLNIDYGQQSQSGADAKVVGTLGNSYSCDDANTAPWELRTLSTRSQQLRARTDAAGSMWIVAGSDSAFEGRTDFYITSVTVRLAPVPQN